MKSLVWIFYIWPTTAAEWTLTKWRTRRLKAAQRKLGQELYEARLDQLERAHELGRSYGNRLRATMEASEE